MHYYVYADSKNRDSKAFGNAYTLSLTSPLRDVTQVDLVSAKVPNSLYNVSNGSNVFTVNGVAYSIAPGYYSAPGLARAIETSTGVSVDYLCDEGRFLMYSKDPFTVSTSLIAATGSLQGSSALAGPTRKAYEGQQVLVSQNIIDLSTHEYIFLDIEELRSVKMVDTKVFSGNTFSGTTISGTFGMIPLDVVSGQIKTFKEDSDYRVRVKYDTPIGSVSKLTIRWLDKDGNVLNFNGFENNSFLLRFHIREPEPMPEPPKEIIKYVPLPSAPIPKKTSSKRWIFYLIVIAMLGGFGWYLFARP